jgi:hypothetical protein
MELKNIGSLIWKLEEENGTGACLSKQYSSF